MDSRFESFLEVVPGSVKHDTGTSQSISEFSRNDSLIIPAPLWVELRPVGQILLIISRNPWIHLQNQASQLVCAEID